MTPKSNDFVIVARIGEIQNSEKKMKQVKPGEELEICVAYAEEKFYAIGDKCTHSGCSLAEGFLTDHEVQCVCHGSKFDIRTGEATGRPAVKPEPVYELKVEGDNVLVKLPI
jgi:nitrite reductase/ring-hydroxylating ferredoxin subunit